MKIVLAPVGTRGDVQPMLALGQALKKAGHEPVLCVAENYRPSVEDLGLRYVRGGRDAKQLMTSPDVKGRGLLGATRVGRPIEVGKIMLREQFATLEEAAHGADAIVGTMLQTAGPSVAEHLGIPYVHACYFPASLPTATLPSPLFATQKSPPWFNRATWRLHNFVENAGLRALVNEYRLSRRLPPVERVGTRALGGATLLMAFDTEIAPLPGDFPPAHATGAWTLDTGAPLPADVEAFLAAGDKPVYIGFGSMPNKDPAGRTAAILEAVRKTGCRALLSAGWAGLGEGLRDPRCKVIDAVNHAALFPRLAAVVHHGGAGTTATALRAGVPQIIVPHMYDQHYWAARVYDRGLGPAPLNARFEADTLAAALRETIGNVTMRQLASAMAERVRASRGTERAMAIIEEQLAARGSARLRAAS